MNDEENRSPIGQSMQVTHDYYGVPLWLMKDYLAQVGANESDVDTMDAGSWCAVLRKATPRHIGSLVIGGTTVEFAGEREALHAMFEKLHWKTWRGGG